jgi:hypothetical protein
MKNIALVLLALITVVSCEKSNDDPYNYMKGGTWTAQRVEVPISDDSVYTIKDTFSLEDAGLPAWVINLYKIERNYPITTNGLGEISEYAYGQFGWSSTQIEADSAIFKFETITPDLTWPTYVDANDYFTAEAVFCATCGDLLEGTLIHKRSKNEMAMLNNKGWIVFTR